MFYYYYVPCSNPHQKHYWQVMLQLLEDAYLLKNDVHGRRADLRWHLQYFRSSRLAFEQVGKERRARVQHETVSLSTEPLSLSASRDIVDTDP